MKDKFKERIHYIITLMLTLLALGLIVYYTFGSFYSIAKEDAITLGETIVKERAETMSNFLLKGKEVMYSTRQNVDYMIQNGCTEDEILHFLEYASQDYAHRMSEDFTGIYGVFNDTYLDGMGWVPEEGYIPQERLWYTAAIEGAGEPVIGSPYVDAQTNQVIISISQMLLKQLHQEEVDKDFISNITSAAALHDIGKIKISDLILNKPGRLTEEEYEVMKMHSIIGGEIVQNILGDHADKKLLQVSTDMAKYHHEKWNGCGYPEGLKGVEIPLASRIMAVADVFDALISKRVYKDAMAVDDAFTILKQESGSHFDPEIVSIFLEFQEKIKQDMNT